MSETTLPAGWVWTTLGEICLVQGGYAFKSKDYQDEGIPLLRISNIDDLKVTFEKNTVFLDRSFLEKQQGFVLKKGDIVMALSGATTGKYGVYKRGDEAFLNQRVGRIQYYDEESVSPGYVFYYFEIIREDILKQAYGAAQPNISPKNLALFEIPLPPLPEQHRIIAEIEKQLTRLDAGVAALHRAQARLQRYKAAVLKAACEGRLVPQNPNDEPAAVLLERILAQRREQWTGKGKYKEPQPPNTDDLPELPVGWVWARMEQLGAIIGGLTKNSKRKAFPLKIPYLRVANVYADELRLDDVQEVGVKESELERITLEKGDLLVVEGNGSLDQIGRVAIWDGSISPCVHQNHIIKVRFNPVALAKYILFWLLSKAGREEITRVASSTSGLYTLSLSKVAALPVPLPPLPEQQRIVAEVERRLSVVEGVEATLTANLHRAERLRQSILKQVFEGRLVPQDPADEPASVLLARIREAKAEAEAKGKKQGRKMKLPGV